MFADRGEREGERERERGQAATKAWTELSLCVILSLYQRCLYRRSVIRSSRATRLREIAGNSSSWNGCCVLPWSVYIYIHTHPFLYRNSFVFSFSFSFFFLLLLFSPPLPSYLLSRSNCSVFFFFFLGELVVVVLCVTRAHLERCFREREYPFREFL